MKSKEKESELGRERIVGKEEKDGEEVKKSEMDVEDKRREIDRKGNDREGERRKREGYVEKVGK